MALCFYAIVRFVPFAETEEFANVGVALYAPHSGYFGFKVLRKRLARITAFFEHVDAALLRRTMVDVRDEMARVEAEFEKLAQQGPAEAGMALWRELTKPKSSQIALSSERVVLTEQPRAQLADLFARYVEHDFEARDKVDRVLDRRVLGWLKTAKLAERFRADAVGNEAFSAKFPFVERAGGNVLKVIKPLSLAQADSVKVFERGGAWVQRLHNLQRQRLLPELVLFTYDGNAEEDTLPGRARRDVLSDLRASGAQTVPIADSRSVLAFAAEAAAV